MCELFFKSAVKNVLMIKDHLIVVLDYHIYVYDLLNEFRIIDSIKTIHNERGICALNSQAERIVLATLHNIVGFLRIENYYLKKNHIIRAFEEEIQYIALSPNGSIVCAAEQYGILIKTFDTVNGAQLHELRRGRNPCEISNIAITPDNTFLALASDKNTIHLYDLKQISTTCPITAAPVDNNKTPTAKQKEEEGGWFYTKGISLLKDYLPQYLNGVNSYAKLHLQDKIQASWLASNALVRGPQVIFSKDSHYFHVISPCGTIFKAKFPSSSAQYECEIESCQEWLEFKVEKKERQMTAIDQHRNIEEQFMKSIDNYDSQRSSSNSKSYDIEEEWVLLK